VSELVCVPGLGLEAAAWRAARGLDARVEELPGYGVRPRRDDDLRPAVLGERLGSLLSRPSVLLGHSASCQVVAHAAAAAPGLVRALVLVGPTTDPRAATWPRLAGRWLRTAAYERPWQVRLLVRSYARTGLGSMGAAMEAARHDDIRRAVRAAAVPVLVVRGRHDRLCPDDWSDALAAHGGPGSRAVTLARGAHMVPLTDPGAVTSAVSCWLDEVLGGE
jgi:pimeloyl-ACP methyl ester carboxylesterase